MSTNNFYSTDLCFCFQIRLLTKEVHSFWVAGFSLCVKATIPDMSKKNFSKQIGILSKEQWRNFAQMNTGVFASLEK